jgi:lipopolysaccharide/colanic/teichoic acid biosynthesis glycosyltransferase
MTWEMIEIRDEQVWLVGLVRWTSIGGPEMNFIRKTSIDEMPQLLRRLYKN